MSWNQGYPVLCWLQAIFCSKLRQICSLREERTWNRRFYSSVTAITNSVSVLSFQFLKSVQSPIILSANQVFRVTKLNLSFISLRGKTPKISPFITTRHKSTFPCTQSPTGSIFRSLAGRNPHTTPAAERAVKHWRNTLEFLFSLCTALVPNQRNWGFSACLSQQSHRVPFRAVIPHSHSSSLGAQPAPQHSLIRLQAPRPALLVTGAQK